MKKFLILLLTAVTAFGVDAANDVVLSQRNAGNTGFIQRNVPAQNAITSGSLPSFLDAIGLGATDAPTFLATNLTGSSGITGTGALTSGSINWSGNIATTGTGSFGALTSTVADGTYGFRVAGATGKLRFLGYSGGIAYIDAVNAAEGATIPLSIGASSVAITAPLSLGSNSLTAGAISGTTGTFTGLIQSSAAGVGFTSTHSAGGAGFSIVRTGGSPSTFTMVNAGGEIVHDYNAVGYGFNISTSRVASLTSTGLNNTVIGATTRANGSFDVLAKNSGTFDIPHPLPSMSATHRLVHSFIEGPRADLIYRGTVKLAAGSASVAIDVSAGMTEGTFVALATNPQVWLQNEDGWTPVRGSVSNGTLTITAKDAVADTVSWLVVAERHDEHIKNTSWTDANGKPILEPEKVVDLAESKKQGKRVLKTEAK